MPRAVLPRYFIFSVILLLSLIALYIFSEARRLQQDLLRQTEAKGGALAEAMATNVQSAILGNSLLEELIAQRLLDNARLIDELLQFPPVDQKVLQELAARNRLQKIELLDLKGKPLDLALARPNVPGMHGEMMARMRGLAPQASHEQQRAMMTFMWGRRWNLRDSTPPKIAERKFWEGSIFGVAIGARSFPGIIAVHANADYILNFRKEIDVQKQIAELGRQSDVTRVALVDTDHKILAHTDARKINQVETNPLLAQVKSSRETFGRIVEEADGSRRYEVVKGVIVNGARMGVLEIGLSLAPMQTAWEHSVRSMVVVGFAILLVGVVGLAAIFYSQQSQLKKISALEAEVSRQARLSELGNLAATVAHEIRNPLNSVSMGLQRLKSEFTPAEDRDEYGRFLDLMQGEVRRLNGIVEQCLSLTRPLNLNLEEISVGQFLNELISLTAGDADGANVKIDLRLAAPLPSLRGDRNSLKQLMLNLILNGIQAMPRGGALTIDARPDKNFLQLAVADEGTGMSPATARRIFDPYFTTKITGSGLGLAIARRIVEAHHGSITVESEPERGTRFLVLLPLESAEA